MTETPPPGEGLRVLHGFQAEPGPAETVTLTLARITQSTKPPFYTSSLQNILDQGR